MANSIYEFRITPMSKEELPQISYALEKRTELLSRNQYPGMWKATDKLNALPKTEKDPKRERIKHILFVVLGVVCLVPGALKPGELLASLIIGAVALLWGVLGLLRGRQQTPKQNNPFDRPAQFLWEHWNTPKDAIVLFTDGYLIISVGGTEDLIPYDKVECIIEAEDIFLLFYAGNVVALKKADFVCGTADGFVGFIAEHTKYIPYQQ